MNILGINYYYHDTAASIVQDGELLVALEEERLSRDKHTWSFPYQSINKVMSICDLKPPDISSIAVSIKPRLNSLNKIIYAGLHLHKSVPFLKHELLSGYNKQRAFWDWFHDCFHSLKIKPKVYFIPHHLSHVVGSFLVSPYENSALLGLDGAGEWATSFLGYGQGRSFTEFNQSYFPNSLGSFYETITQYCGFRPNYDEGKTMGLAPLGDPEHFYKKMSELIKIDRQGGIKIDLSYFNYQFWQHTRYSSKFINTFGQPRTSTEFDEHHLHVAAAAQRVLEDRILELSNILFKKTKSDYLVMAGGVALNSVANGRVIREGPFKDIYVMPAAGDNGSGIGASYVVYNNILDKPRNFIHLDPYTGTTYDNKYIEKLISEYKLSAKCYDNICKETAQLLNDGNIIGWFQGKMEIGPRSLGNRSILADPGTIAMKDKINSEVKHRETYRPFAPSCIVEASKTFFDSKVEAPFMLKVCNVKKEMQDKLAAITHVDGSARLQTVSIKINPLYHKLLTEFEKLSGIPVLLNTSFNIMGEPIVESPTQAIRCFFSTGLDKLVLGNYIISK